MPILDSVPQNLGDIEATLDDFLAAADATVTGRTVLLQHTDVGGFHQRAEDQDSEVDEDLSHVRSLDEKLIEVAVVTRELVEVDPHLVQDGDVEM